MIPAWLKRLSFLLILLGLCLLTLRLISTHQAMNTEPGTSTTSGCEEESWLALWHILQGAPAYADPSQAPFRASYFNWFFYFCHAGILQILSFFFEQPPLIAATRFVTLAFGLLGLGGIWALLLTLHPPPST
ncbi:MAG: hypothetical protein HC904_12775, partial [Blastochloris sp.]|nr:hypothetical protein [Blastochloris sp.]